MPHSVTWVSDSAPGREKCSSARCATIRSTSAGWISTDRAGDGNDLAAAAEELGSAALVGVDVGEVVAEDGVIAWADVGEGERVGGGATADQEDLAVGGE